MPPGTWRRQGAYQFQVRLPGETKWWDSGSASSANTRTITKSKVVSYTFRVLVTGTDGKEYVSGNTVAVEWTAQ